jgi:hypothetical protein
MTHSHTFRRVCAAEALGHIEPLSVNESSARRRQDLRNSIRLSVRSSERDADSSGEIPVLIRIKRRTVGKKCSNVSRRESVARTMETANAQESPGVTACGVETNEEKKAKAF